MQTEAVKCCVLFEVWAEDIWMFQWRRRRNRCNIENFKLPTWPFRGKPIRHNVIIQTMLCSNISGRDLSVKYLSVFTFSPLYIYHDKEHSQCCLFLSAWETENEAMELFQNKLHKLSSLYRSSLSSSATNLPLLFFRRYQVLALRGNFPRTHQAEATQTLLVSGIKSLLVMVSSGDLAMIIKT